MENGSIAIAAITATRAKATSPAPAVSGLAIQTALVGLRLAAFRSGPAAAFRRSKRRAAPKGGIEGERSSRTANSTAARSTSRLDGPSETTFGRPIRLASRCSTSVAISAGREGRAAVARHYNRP